jgi:hypothetical protein
VKPSNPCPLPHLLAGLSRCSLVQLSHARLSPSPLPALYLILPPPPFTLHPPTLTCPPPPHPPTPTPPPPPLTPHPSPPLHRLCQQCFSETPLTASWCCPHTVLCQSPMQSLCQHTHSPLSWSQQVLLGPVEPGEALIYHTPCAYALCILHKVGGGARHHSVQLTPVGARGGGGEGKGADRNTQTGEYILFKPTVDFLK